MKTYLGNIMALFFVLLLADQAYLTSVNTGFDTGKMAVNEDIKAFRLWEPLFNESFTPEAAWSGARVLNGIIKLPKIGPVNVDMSAEALAATCL
ncbi:MAG: hypothetical protein HQL30_06285 [Candidatus Omnitrophica bacterium]|nr:hypothetical protein [Candidatus Omnitrophota bacterium]